MKDLDRSHIVFSKRHFILVQKNLSDFYTIKLRKPLSGDNEKHSIRIQIQVSNPNEIQVDPALVTLDNRNQQVTIKISNVIDPTETSINESDRQYEITHTTSSRVMDLHNLNITLPCYSLGNVFKEILACGKDDQCQLGSANRVEQLVSTKYRREQVDPDSVPAQVNCKSDLIHQDLIDRD